MKQSTSKEINCAKHEYMNISPLDDRVSYASEIFSRLSVDFVAQLQLYKERVENILSYRVFV